MHCIRGNAVSCIHDHAMPRIHVNALPRIHGNAVHFCIHGNTVPRIHGRAVLRETNNCSWIIYQMDNIFYSKMIRVDLNPLAAFSLLNAY